MLPNTDVNLNFFVKPNEQSSNLFENSAMARKGRQSQLFHRDDIYFCKIKKKTWNSEKIHLIFISKEKKRHIIGEKEAMSVLFFSKKCQGAYQKIIFHFHIFHDNDVLHCVWDKFLGEGIVIIYNYIF